MKNISFISDEKLSDLIELVSEQELMSKSLLIRSVLFNWFSTNYKSLVAQIYD